MDDYPEGTLGADIERLGKAVREVGRAVLKEFAPILKLPPDWLVRILKRVGIRA